MGEIEKLEVTRPWSGIRGSQQEDGPQVSSDPKLQERKVKSSKKQKLKWLSGRIKKRVLRLHA